MTRKDRGSLSRGFFFWRRKIFLSLLRDRKTPYTFFPGKIFFGAANADDAAGKLDAAVKLDAAGKLDAAKKIRVLPPVALAPQKQSQSQAKAKQKLIYLSAPECPLALDYACPAKAGLSLQQPEHEAQACPPPVCRQNRQPAPRHTGGANPLEPFPQPLPFQNSMSAHATFSIYYR